LAARAVLSADADLLVCVPDAWLFCVVVNLVICVSMGLLHIFLWLLVVSSGSDFVFSVTVKRLSGKSLSNSKMTYFVLSGMQHLNSVNQSICEGRNKSAFDCLIS